MACRLLSPRFNEAGGFLPRKPGMSGKNRTGAVFAAGFNEAGGFLPRKLIEAADGDNDQAMLQ